MENCAGRAELAAVAVIFAVVTLRFLVRCLKHTISMLREYDESLGRDKEYQLFVLAKIDISGALRAYLKAAAFSALAGLTFDAYRGYFFYTYGATVALAALAASCFLQRKYLKRSRSQPK